MIRWKKRYLDEIVTEVRLMELTFSLSVMEEESAEDVFSQNIRYAEWWHRKRTRKQQSPLRKRLETLFSELPKEAVDLITDDPGRLIGEMVRTRNVLVHADQSRRSDIARGRRLKVVTTKLGVLLWLHTGLTDFGDEAVRDAVIGIGTNRSLNKYLSPTDRLNGGQLQLPF